MTTNELYEKCTYNKKQEHYIRRVLHWTDDVVWHRATAG